MSHPVVWFEIMGSEAEPLKTFYRDLFGWKINDDEYGLVETGSDKGIPGGVGAFPGDEKPATLTIYVEVPDLQKALDQAVGLGAEVVFPPTEMPDVAFAAFRDPAGNHVGIVRG